MNNDFLFWFSAGSFILYVVINLIIYGWLDSFSESYYKHHKSWLFFLFTVAAGLPITMMAEDGFMFFSGVSLLFCGAAPAFKGKDKTQVAIHVIGATGAVVFCLLSLTFIHKVWMFTLMQGLFLLVVEATVKKHKLLWNETFAMMNCYAGIYVVLTLNL